VRAVRHEQLFELTIGHIDCDAFFASVEKRDNPGLRDRPVIVGGVGARGVVSTACYIARMFGVRSAMPMVTARRLCPHAVVLAPDMRKYACVSAQVRDMLEALTPLVKMLSIDEAVVDLAGTQNLHHAPPAIVLNRFARAVERELGITVSIGLATNRLLAKLAAERGKPRGFYVLGAEAPVLLASEQVSLLPGVGLRWSSAWGNWVLAQSASWRHWMSG
jgi:DNA polymerase-4